jgi:penicillin-binding protein 2
VRPEKLKDFYRERKTFIARAAVAAVICLSLAGVLVYRLTDLQIVQQSYYASRAEDNRTRLQPVAPVRGLIYDRNGVVLAQNSPAFVLEITPEKVLNMDDTLQRLSALMRVDPQDIARFRAQVRKSPRYRGVPLRSSLTLEEVAQFELNRYAFPGVDVTAGLTRNYPMGASAAHLVGYVSAINEDELRSVEARQYEGLTQIGKIGIEKSYEDTLRGTPGSKLIEANAYGRPLRELESRPGTPGRNLILTIDSKVQAVAEEALGELDGAVVALNPRNGEVIALVSKPGFDPHLFIGGIDSKTYKSLLDDRDRPLYNRALQGTYPPGSTIKPFMALAALSYGLIDTHHTEYCSGEFTLPGSSRKYRCFRRTGHGSIDLKDAVSRSCDVYFYKLAVMMGIDRIAGFLGHYGLGKPTGVDLPQERSGILPSPEWKQRARKQVWFPGETVSVGVGQGYMTLTPMQLAQIAALMASGGKGYVPHLVSALQDPISGERTPVEPTPLPDVEIKRHSDWQKIIEAMTATTSEQGGTGFRTFGSAPYVAAGKSGTAQVAALSQTDKKARKLEDTPFYLRDNALFIAFAPANDPQIAVAVVAEHAGFGGAVAAPVARRVIDQYLLGKVLYTGPLPTRVADVPTTHAEREE